MVCKQSDMSFLYLNCYNTTITTTTTKHQSVWELVWALSRTCFVGYILLRIGYIQHCDALFLATKNTRFILFKVPGCGLEGGGGLNWSEMVINVRGHTSHTWLAKEKGSCGGLTAHNRSNLQHIIHWKQLLDWRGLHFLIPIQLCFKQAELPTCGCWAQSWPDLSANNTECWPAAPD